MISEMTENLSREAMLLHGAIGLTWDYDLGFLFRRGRAAALQYGDARFHRDRMVSLMANAAKA